MDMKLPDKMTKKKLRKITWFKKLFRPYIRNLTAGLSQFYIKLKQRKLEWKSEDNEKLTKIFHKIYKRPILKFPDLNKDFLMFCDTSETGMGAALYQESKIIGIFSSIYKCAEKNYTVAEKEM
ncbi:Retrovirus-related Pol polyprotein from transposon gypsy [Dictyocoela muelleri]|nr:Retrovirus-related Pol polyprotein from transposon gypsy [Dictyocoela muelleri]